MKNLNQKVSKNTIKIGVKSLFPKYLFLYPIIKITGLTYFIYSNKNKVKKLFSKLNLKLNSNYIFKNNDFTKLNSIDFTKITTPPRRKNIISDYIQNSKCRTKFMTFCWGIFCGYFLNKLIFFGTNIPFAFAFWALIRNYTSFRSNLYKFSRA